MRDLANKLALWVASGVVAGLIGWGMFSEKLSAQEKVLDRHEAELSALKGVAADVKTIKEIVLKKLVD